MTPALIAPSECKTFFIEAELFPARNWLERAKFIIPNVFLELSKCPIYLDVDIIDLTVESINAQCNIEHNECQKYYDQNNVLDQEQSPLVHAITVPH